MLENHSKANVEAAVTLAGWGGGREISWLPLSSSAPGPIPCWLLEPLGVPCFSCRLGTWFQTVPLLFPSHFCAPLFVLCGVCYLDRFLSYKSNFHGTSCGRAQNKTDDYTIYQSMLTHIFIMKMNPVLAAVSWDYPGQVRTRILRKSALMAALPVTVAYVWLVSSCPSSFATGPCLESGIGAGDLDFGQ